MGDGADLLGEIGDGAHLVAVPVDHGGVQLERQARLLARLDARHGEVVGVGKAPELVVLGGIEAVDADAHRHGSAFLKAPGDLFGDERAVRAEHRAQAGTRRMGDQIEDIGAQKRLAAREDHDLEPGTGDLVDHLHALFGGKLALLLLFGILVAVHALEIALVRRHP